MQPDDDALVSHHGTLRGMRSKRYSSNYKDQRGGNRTLYYMLSAAIYVGVNDGSPSEEVERIINWWVNYGADSPFTRSEKDAFFAHLWEVPSGDRGGVS